MGDKGKKMKEYAKFLSDRKLSGSTLEIYIREAEKFKDFIGEDKITKGKVEEYVQGLKSSYKIATVNLYIIALNLYLKYIGKESVSVKPDHVQKRRNLENVISADEYNEILRYTDTDKLRKYYLIIRTLASTGIRVSELEFITVGRLDSGFINVYNKGRAREVYLPDYLIAEMKLYCRSNEIMDGTVFLGKTGKAISRIAVWQMLQKIAADLSIPKEKVHPHSFRHFFAKTYMEKYGNLFDLADILGHSSVETTRIYTISTVEEKRKKIERLGM